MSESRLPKTSRPLSPHLQIYRWQITSVLSILHRMTGVGLALGCGFVAWWLVSAMAGYHAYGAFYAVAKSIPGQVVLFGFLWAFVYHTLNGIRHLVWDTGRLFELKDAARAGWAVVAGSAVLTLLFWFI